MLHALLLQDKASLPWPLSSTAKQYKCRGHRNSVEQRHRVLHFGERLAFLHRQGRSDNVSLAPFRLLALKVETGGLELSEPLAWGNVPSPVCVGKVLEQN